MKDKLLKFILVLSLLLNFSFLGGAAYTHYRQAHAPFVPGPASMHGMPGAFGPDMLFRELSLKPKQVRLFQQKVAVFHPALLKKGEEVEGLRTSLLDLMGAPNPDNKAIDETIGRINKAQEEMQKIMVSHMLEFKTMLDEEQQKKFIDLVRGAMDVRREQVCP